MTWTAKLVRKEREGVYLNVFIEYSNGIDITFVEPIPILRNQDKNYLKNQVYNRIAQLTDLDTYSNTVVPGIIDPVAPVDPVPAPPPVPTPEELAAQTYNKNLNKLRHMDNAVKLGIMNGTETAYATLKQQLINNFIPAYLDFF